jgi:septum formation protein
MLVLASTSPYRAALLQRLGLPFLTAAPACDEEALKDPALPIDRLVAALALAKANSLIEQFPHAHVLGGDQMVELDGEALGKPYTRDRAIEQLTRMSGRSHRLWTAIALVSSDGYEDVYIDQHTLTLRSLATDEIERYVDGDTPLDCAGSYKIESRGIALVDRIEGSDFTAITGLPLIALSRMLRARGFVVP